MSKVIEMRDMSHKSLDLGLSKIPSSAEQKEELDLLQFIQYCGFLELDWKVTTIVDFNAAASQYFNGKTHAYKNYGEWQLKRHSDPAVTIHNIRRCNEIWERIKLHERNLKIFNLNLGRKELNPLGEFIVDGKKAVKAYLDGARDREEVKKNVDQWLGLQMQLVPWSHSQSGVDHKQDFERVPKKIISAAAFLHQAWSHIAKEALPLPLEQKKKKEIVIIMADLKSLDNPAYLKEWVRQDGLLNGKVCQIIVDSNVYWNQIVPAPASKGLFFDWGKRTGATADREIMGLAKKHPLFAQKLYNEDFSKILQKRNPTTTFWWSMDELMVMVQTLLSEQQANNTFLQAIHSELVRRFFEEGGEALYETFCHNYNDSTPNNLLAQWIKNVKRIYQEESHTRMIHAFLMCCGFLGLDWARVTHATLQAAYNEYEDDTNDRICRYDEWLEQKGLTKSHFLKVFPPIASETYIYYMKAIKNFLRDKNDAAIKNYQGEVYYQEDRNKWELLGSNDRLIATHQMQWLDKRELDEKHDKYPVTTTYFGVSIITSTQFTGARLFAAGTAANSHTGEPSVIPASPAAAVNDHKQNLQVVSKKSVPAPAMLDQGGKKIPRDKKEASPFRVQVKKKEGIIVITDLKKLDDPAYLKAWVGQDGPLDARVCKIIVDSNVYWNQVVPASESNGWFFGWGNRTQATVDAEKMVLAKKHPLFAQKLYNKDLSYILRIHRDGTPWWSMEELMAMVQTTWLSKSESYDTFFKAIQGELVCRFFEKDGEALYEIFCKNYEGSDPNNLLTQWVKGVEFAYQNEGHARKVNAFLSYCGFLGLNWTTVTHDALKAAHTEYEDDYTNRLGRYREKMKAYKPFPGFRMDKDNTRISWAKPILSFLSTVNDAAIKGYQERARRRSEEANMDWVVFGTNARYTITEEMQGWWRHETELATRISKQQSVNDSPEQQGAKDIVKRDQKIQSRMDIDTKQVRNGLAQVTANTKAPTVGATNSAAAPLTVGLFAVGAAAVNKSAGEPVAAPATADTPAHVVSPTN